MSVDLYPTLGKKELPVKKKSFNAVCFFEFCGIYEILQSEHQHKENLTDSYSFFLQRW